MAARWKKFSRKTITKTIGFILLIISLMAGVYAGLEIHLNVEHYESITEKDYKKSNVLSDELRYAASRLEYILRYYKSEENIKEGQTVRHISIEDSWQLTNLYNNYLGENNLENNAESQELFWSEKEKEIAEVKEIIMKGDLANYQQIISDLNTPSGLIYYATDSVNICTNTNNSSKGFYSKMNASLLIDEEGVIINPNNGENTYSPSLIDRFPSIEEGIDKVQIYVGITDEGLIYRANKWNYDRYILMVNIVIIGICALLALSLFIYLLAVAGKRVQDEEIHLILLDKMYTDINLIIIIGIVTVCFINFYNVLNIKYSNVNLMKFTFVSAVGGISTLFIALFMSIAKHIKKGTMIKYSFTFIALSRIITILITIFNSGPLMLKSIAGIIALMIATIFSLGYPMMLFAVLIFAVFFVYTKVKKFKAIQEGIKIAREGDYEFKIELSGNGEFKSLSDDINTITDGLKVAVQNKVKSERFKTELITNVSHDIKTPLTSIISYVDLLKREGLNSSNAPKYLDVLDRKSNRLKTLTEDLFEAAKVTSGSVTVNFQKININSLVSQIMGELDEKIQESKLEFIINSTDDRIYGYADGRQLSRVMENLISNIVKYALKGSRVYIDIDQNEKQVSVTFKNVSAYKLNMPVDELMERFKRGDESRSSEGNGLGLAIANSLMELQKGALNLSIDGDLFKAEVLLINFKIFE